MDVQGWAEYLARGPEHLYHRPIVPSRDNNNDSSNGVILPVLAGGPQGLIMEVDWRGGATVAACVKRKRTDEEEAAYPGLGGTGHQTTSDFMRSKKRRESQ